MYKVFGVNAFVRYEYNHGPFSSHRNAKPGFNNKGFIPLGKAKPMPK